MNNPTPKKEHDIFIPFNYPIINKIKLIKEFNNQSIDFLNVLYSRRSVKPSSSLPINKLSELLFHSLNIHSLSINEKNYITTKRTTPSAGGRHPVDLMILQNVPQYNKMKLNYYNPIDHSLNELKISNKYLISFIEEVNENINLNDSTLIWFVIQKNKTGSKYLNPESLYWKDTGALLYCLQLVSTYLGIKSCPIGSLASNSFHKLFNNNEIISGGGLIVGT